ncbi:thioredoxin domain-containing protein [Stappia sp. GBMRC 2046]|uniref:Thioredoxin domain-containing protein n=1 Tax=Stappia sediminis TaxID=2692190 RepID=A0A7X3LRN6_9HYPH|nr:DsbA family oxidoreductase [Stappia sediminis]MXN63848.1 thioredoxin domain-containing protein [Stappia sediminis]
MTASETGSTRIRVDLVSDVVCPWCIVGYKQLEKAVGKSGVGVELYWHPFELNPKMPQEGQNLREHIAEKYGTTPEQSVAARERLTNIGAELGFAFRYADDMRMYNTFQAHQLLHWAQEQGRQTELKLELFSTFFTNRKDVSDPAVLAAAAGRVGLDEQEARKILDENRYADAVRSEERFWIERGIQGVPAFILNRKYLVSGAQGADALAEVLTQVSAEEAA